MSAPLLWDGDVVVVGGGSAGCAAAVAAARAGARTLLIEAAGFLGGTGAAVLDTFYGFYAPGGDGTADSRVVGGVGWEVAAALLAGGQAFERPNSYGAGTGVTYEPEALKRVWDRLTHDAGVATLLHTMLVDVTTTARRITELTVVTKAGTHTVRANTVVDASGDAEVAWRASAALERPARDQKTQPLTATFRLGGVDTGVISTKDLHERLAKAAESGRYRLPRREGSVHRTVLPGVVHTNLTRVGGVDPTDPWQLSAAEAEGRAQVAEYVRFLTEEVPGYEDAYLLSTSVRIGVRETRRLIGRYVLTRDDVLAAREFPDAVARCGAPVEDHDDGESTIWEYVGGHRSGRSYGVPYRCLLPGELDNLAVAGRCLSATHDAHASVRSMAQCMALGQAAGTAAALAPDGAVGELDAAVLRDRLTADGAVL
ncbi:FAD-dependent oxidoreductase [Jiangella alkaliphila]|uniref:FAD dependent oxidoreductase n=1 Tax=Jiangella alkaliphila TaxID=419479 RepID=A0A1H2LAG5_9ACTN|nr:FAD-dependent oxidoreductase [Jiangella alkaliphila]SDU77571.1 FAD dependent oxidoreductase [Jiangella alkaliphila]